MPIQGTNDQQGRHPDKITYERGPTVCLIDMIAPQLRTANALRVTDLQTLIIQILDAIESKEVKIQYKQTKFNSNILYQNKVKVVERAWFILIFLSSFFYQTALRLQGGKSVILWTPFNREVNDQIILISLWC